MLKIFYLVDSDYGARVEKGLSATTFSSLMSGFAQKLGLSSDKSSLIGEKSAHEMESNEPK